MCLQINIRNLGCTNCLDHTPQEKLTSHKNWMPSPMRVYTHIGLQPALWPRLVGFIAHFVLFQHRSMGATNCWITRILIMGFAHVWGWSGHSLTTIRRFSGMSYLQPTFLNRCPHSSDFAPNLTPTCIPVSAHNRLAHHDFENAWHILNKPQLKLRGDSNPFIYHNICLYKSWFAQGASWPRLQVCIASQTLSLK